MVKLKNPIITGFYPDPSICYDEKSGNYYLVTSTFEFFPGVPIFKSRDLLNWEQVGHCLSRESQLPLEKAKPSDGIYAPTIRVYKGKFYMVTTNIGTSGHILVTTDNPEGEWSEPIFITPESPDFEVYGIDPSLFFDDDGTVYFSYTENEIRQCEIDINTGICKPWKPLWSGTGERFVEAPHLYKIKGKYYLLIAEGGVDIGHRASIARSDSPWGPFEPCPHNPILSNKSIHTTLNGVGHGDMIQDTAGNWWIVFLGFRHANPYFHHLGRETLIAPVEWDENGWPVVNKTGTIDYETLLDRSITLHPWPKKPVRDYFNVKALDWVHLRNPRMENYLLRDGLTLFGCELGLSSPTGSPTMMLCRQREFDMDVAARFSATLPKPGDEVGLTVYYDYCHHYDFYLTRKEDMGIYLVVRKTIGDLCGEVYSCLCSDSAVELTIRADKDRYYFECDGAVLATALTQYVSTEATIISFTGVMVGVFAVGVGARGVFEWFEKDFRG